MRKMDRMSVQQKLVDANVPGQQARAHAEVYGELQDELATKSDLEETNKRIDETNRKVEQIVVELGNLRVEISKAAVKLVLWTVSTILATGGMVVAIFRLVPG